MLAIAILAAVTTLLGGIAAGECLYRLVGGK